MRMTEGQLPRTKQERNLGRARAQRATMSLPEVLLWQLLRQSPDGVRIRRQHPIGAYVLDFYCAAAKIGFEIDGIAHNLGDRPVRDTARDAWLSEQGIEVVRIPATEILRSPEDIAEAIVRYCRR